MATDNQFESNTLAPQIPATLASLPQAKQPYSPLNPKAYESKSFNKKAWIINKLVNEYKVSFSEARLILNQIRHETGNKMWPVIQGGKNSNENTGYGFTQITGKANRDLMTRKAMEENKPWAGTDFWKEPQKLLDPEISLWATMKHLEERRSNLKMRKDEPWTVEKLNMAINPGQKERSLEMIKWLPNEMEDNAYFSKSTPEKTPQWQVDYNNWKKEIDDSYNPKPAQQVKTAAPIIKQDQGFVGNLMDKMNSYLK